MSKRRCYYHRDWKRSRIHFRTRRSHKGSPNDFISDFCFLLHPPWASVQPSMGPSMDPPIHPWIHPWIQGSVHSSKDSSIHPWIHPSIQWSHSFDHVSIQWSHSYIHVSIHNSIHSSTSCSPQQNKSASYPILFKQHTHKAVAWQIFSSSFLFPKWKMRNGNRR